MKTKLTKEQLKERGSEVKKIVLSSRSGAIIRNLDLSEQHAEDIANVLAHMCLEDLVVTDLLDVRRPSESQIARRVVIHLERHADKLREFSKIFKAYSRMKRQAARELRVDSLAGG